MSERIRDLARHLIAGAVSERQRAVRIHDFVREEIVFGFRRPFEAASPEQTLAARIGHCTPQSALFVALLRAAGLSACQHFIVIDRDILRGVLPDAWHRLVPWEISHSYASVRIGRCWCRLDSYLVDSHLWRAGCGELGAGREAIGYAVHRFGTNTWEGTGDAFSQFASADMLLADHGVFDRPEHYYHSQIESFHSGPERTDEDRIKRSWSRETCPPRAGPFRFAELFAGDREAGLGERCVNARLDRLRAKWRTGALGREIRNTGTVAPR